MEDHTPFISKKANEIVLVTNSRGFSLVELVIVIAIIALIGSISIPNILSMRAKSSVRADARDVHSSLRLAQTLAVKKGIDVCVRVHDSNTYFVYDAISAREPKELRPGNSFFESDQFEDPNQVCFTMRGLTNDLGGGIKTVKLRNSSLEMLVSLTPAGHIKSTASDW